MKLDAGALFSGAVSGGEKLAAQIEGPDNVVLFREVFRKFASLGDKLVERAGVFQNAPADDQMSRMLVDLQGHCFCEEGQPEQGHLGQESVSLLLEKLSQAFPELSGPLQGPFPHSEGGEEQALNFGPFGAISTAAEPVEDGSELGFQVQLPTQESGQEDSESSTPLSLFPEAPPKELEAPPRQEPVSGLSDSEVEPSKGEVIELPQNRKTRVHEGEEENEREWNLSDYFSTSPKSLPVVRAVPKKPQLSVIDGALANSEPQDSKTHMGEARYPRSLLMEKGQWEGKVVALQIPQNPEQLTQAIEVSPFPLQPEVSVESSPFPVQAVQLPVVQEPKLPSGEQAPLVASAESVSPPIVTELNPSPALAEPASQVFQESSVKVRPVLKREATSTEPIPLKTRLQERFRARTSSASELPTIKVQETRGLSVPAAASEAQASQGLLQSFQSLRGKVRKLSSDEGTNLLEGGMSASQSTGDKAAASIDLSRHLVTLNQKVAPKASLGLPPSAAPSPPAAQLLWSPEVLSGGLEAGAAESASLSEGESPSSVFQLGQSSGLPESVAGEVEQLGKMSAQSLSRLLEQRLSKPTSSPSHRLEIDLDPEHLGQVKVELTMDHQSKKIETLFVVSNESAREALEQQMPGLKVKLAEQGVDFDSRLSLASENRGDADTNSGRQSRQGRKGGLLQEEQSAVEADRSSRDEGELYA